MKTVDEIYEELVADYADRAGYTPDDSCDQAVRLYAVAAQIQALTVQASWVLDQSFPQTAQGEFLDYHAAMRGLTRSEASKASGTLRFSIPDAAPADLVVGGGTVCMTADEVKFETTEDAVLHAGSLFVDVPAEALQAGASGNVAAKTIHMMTAYPTGITACINPGAFSGGSDAEDDESLRKRILESYQRLPNGANAAYYEKTALSHDGVAAAKAVGRARGIGTVDVYITSNGGVPDTNLINEVQSDLAEKREIAVDVKVMIPTKQSVNVSVELSVADGKDFSAVKTSVEQALTGYFTGKLLGKPVLPAELGQLIYAVDGVTNYHILAPAADLAGDDTVLPILGTLTVTEI